MIIKINGCVVQLVAFYCEGPFRGHPVKVKDLLKIIKSNKEVIQNGK